MSTRTFMSRLVVGLFSFAAVAAPADALAQSNGTSIQDRTIPTFKLDAKLTREQMDTQVTRGLRLTGGRYILWSTDNSRWEYSDGASPPVWAALSSGTGTTLDTAHAAGATITVNGTESPVGIVDARATGSGGLTISSVTAATGAVNKNLINVSDAAVNSTSGIVNGVNVDFSGASDSGAGSVRGVTVTMASSGDYGLYIGTGKASIAGDLAVGGALAVTGAFTIGAITSSGASDSFTSTATTGNAFLFTADSLTTGKGIRLVSSSAGFDQAGGGRAISVYDGASQVYDVGIDGTTHIAGTSSGTTALLVDAGDEVLTSGALTLTAGALTLTSGSETVTSGDLTLAAGKVTVTPANTGTKGLVISGSSTRTVALEEITASGVYSQPQVKWTASGAGTGDFFSGAISAAASGNFFKNAVGAVAFTGDVENTDLGSTCTTCQAYVATGGAAARTTSMVQLTDASTGAAADTIAVASANTSSTGAEQRLTESANFAGAGLVVSTDAAAVGAYGLKISAATRVFTSPLVDVSIGASNSTAPAFLVTTTQTGAATGTTHGYSFVSTGTGYLGSGFKATLGASTGASVLTGTTSGGSRTSALVDLTDAGTSSGHTVKATASGIGSGDIYYGTFSAAGTGNGAELDMGSNVAGTGVKVLSAATTGVGLSVASTGVLASSAAVRNVVSLSATGAWDADTTNASYVLNVAQSTGAGALGDYACRISATGTNVEGLLVDDGTSQFDEGVTIGRSGTGTGGAGANPLVLYPPPGSRALQIDASTSGNRPTHTNGALDVAVTTATASTRTGRFTTTVSGDRAGVIGVESNLTAAGLATGTDLATAFKASVTGTSSTAGVIAGYTADFASDPTIPQAGFAVTGTKPDFSFTVIDNDMVTQPYAQTAGAGYTHLVAAGDGNTSGNGGALTVRAGDAAGANTGGGLTIRSGAGNSASTDGTIVIGQGGTTRKLTIDSNATAGDLGAVLTFATASTLSPTVIKSYGTNDAESIAGASLGVVTGTTRKGVIFTQAALGTDIAAFPFPCTPYVDVSADMTVTLTWTGIAAVGGSDVRWNVAVQSVADNGDGSTSLTSVATTVDTLTAVKQQERLTFTITGGTLVANSKAIIVVRRDGAVGTDTDTSNAYLTNLDVAYRVKGLY